jgi:hypothetical protein
MTFATRGYIQAATCDTHMLNTATIVGTLTMHDAASTMHKPALNITQGPWLVAVRQYEYI